MARSKKSDPLAELKQKLPKSAPWIALALNVVAAGVALIAHYKKQTDQAFVKPYTHMHYVDAEGSYICGDRYIDKRHMCDGRFLIVGATMPTLDDFMKIGLTKEQWAQAQAIIKQFKCSEDKHEKD
jgi:hypothetical protein